MKIGIDLDNTIIDYNKSFLLNSFKYKFLKIDYLKKKNNKSNKTYVKNKILKLKNGKFKWEFLQGRVYGRLINRADIYSGFKDFLNFCYINNIQLYIISHKSVNAHYDDKVNLRDVAINYLKKNKILKKNSGILKKNIFFCDSITEKIKKINELNCNFIIDDLIEVLDHKEINKTVNKIHFSNKKNKKTINSFSNWFDIKDFILLENRKYLINKKLNNTVQEIKTISNIGNSNVFLIYSNNKKYVAKFYPENDFKRERIKRERKAYNFLNHENIQKNKLQNRFYIKENFSIIEFFKGKKLKKINNEIISSQIEFLKKINLVKVKKNKFMNASASCLSFKDIKKQLDLRFEKIRSIKFQSRVKSFIDNDLFNFKNKLIIDLKKIWPSQYNKKLKNKNQILSPSDFGIQNILKFKNDYRFIDFEYFGWDDPAKLLSDIIHHPSVEYSKNNKKILINKFSELVRTDKNFNKRFYCLYYLLAICWCLIIISKIQNLNNYYNNPKNLKIIKNKNNFQFNKARTLLKKTISEYNNNKNGITFS